MKKIFHKFNMVEVMLAIVVISVGMASVFVLFPTGLNAHKDAAADNSMADLAEYIFATVRTTIDVENSKDAAEQKDVDNSFYKKSDWANAVDEAPNDVKEGNVASVGWKEIALFNSTSSTKSVNELDADKVSLLQHPTKKNIFWVRQMSGPDGDGYVDFSAIGRVYVDRGTGTGVDNEFFLTVKGNTPVKYGELTENEKTFPNPSGSGSFESDPRYFLLPMVLELSYPAEKPEYERVKKYFRFEIFNEYYEATWT